MLLPPGREDELPAIMERIRRGEKVEHYETKRRRKDGTVIDVSLAVSPIKTPDGETVGASAVARDITERKQAAENKQAEAMHRLLLERVLSAQEEERRRIARELHDEAGQLLTSLLVGLRTLEDSRNVADAKAKGHRLREITAQAIEEVGRLARGLHPTALDDHGLDVALSRYVTEYAKTHNIAVELKLGKPDSSALPPGVQIGLYRILQEALTNVARHSRAATVSIKFARSATALQVVVTDNGRGFDTKAATNSSSHLGIQSMRERAAMLGGTVSFTSKSTGTRMLVQIPLTGQHDVRPFVRRKKL
jgi:signal transduction histidine kinase